MDTFDLTNGRMEGAVVESQKKLCDLKGVFADEAARAAMPQDTLVYRVQMHDKEREGTEGGLLFGTSYVQPGSVDGEYFMTRGHYHLKRHTAEYYFCISGKGALILMDETGKTWMEEMRRGTLHYIAGGVAHRLANTGDEELVIGCCWPSDAGHDYATIERTGFAKRLMCVDGKPELV